MSRPISQSPFIKPASTQSAPLSNQAGQLNPEQQRAVRHISGPLLVLAGAGSGKTSVITRKIAHLIENCDTPARYIAAVTFTNKAAREMKQRVGKLLSKSAVRGLTVSTFHNLGLNIIRREVSALGLRSGFTIFDSEDSRSIIKELLISDGNEDLIDMAQNQISRWKNSLLSPEQASSQAENKGEEVLARLYGRYQQALTTYNAVDFDDLIFLPIQVFQQHPDRLGKWRQRIRYLLVDEYQDTNLAQYELVKLLAGERQKLTVVGDDDQSIYAWRGANPENLTQLQADFPDLEVVKLEQNYRSTARILKAANSLIANNPHVFDKTLWSDLGFGEPIRLIRCPSEDAEAETVVNEILYQKMRRGCRFRDFAVLYRGNHQAKLLELKLQAQTVPYQLSGGTSFYARTEIKDILAYLRLLVNPDDDNAFLRIINTPRRQIGHTTLEKLSLYARDREIGLYAACGELGLGQVVTDPALDRLRRFQHWFDSVVRNCHSNQPMSAIREMVNDIDYESWLVENASSTAVAEGRMKNIHLLLDQLEKSLKKHDDEDDPDSIDAAIARLVLMDLLDRQAEESADDRVQLMTLHAAKGLEFPHVFLIGMEEGLLPHRNSVESGDIEEERRLAYVGITRARQTLTFTLTAKRKQFGETSNTTPSRFLDELPADDIEREGFGEAVSDEQKKQKGRKSLGDLKDLFN